ncbi:TPA: sensor histidine kinase [Klebsiella variicola]|uniref:sensor histidine kinase n=1 Tax=Klebsiella variicola TaxID=244366 RepID=UPI000E2AA0B9|nr:ATP-binding protein [Klebsiella variicola]SXE52609.1 two-component system sensor protein [Klebsiella variicola]VAR93383.1 two-component system sensor protein [Klebsiella variicola]HED1713905.1 HAMP domain-containing protein [Klebsiella variicola subsp. variicola]
MKTLQQQTLWRWICVRILALAIGSVVVIAVCMWLRFAVQSLWNLHRMPPALREEFTLLRTHPELNPARFHEIVDTWWGVRYSDPSIASADWLTVGILVGVMIPFIVVLGLRAARPLSLQFSRLAAAARAVAAGDFSARAAQVDSAPLEMARFTQDFNAMMQQLARYDRELRASHVAMAHELRSPLTAAIGRLQGMMDGVFMPEPRQLAMVMKQLQLLSRLTDELHLLSLADAGQLTLNKTQTDLTALLRERVAWLGPQAQTAGMTLSITSREPCLCLVDPVRLGQVITIVMENALRYAAEGGEVTVSTQATPVGARMVFRDQGPGVPADFLQVMFERFTRGESSRARHSGGSGLGLSIARGICEAHGGTIHAAPGETGGLVITVTLPAHHGQK